MTPEHYQQTTVDDRRSTVEKYWQDARPHRVLGPGAESFEQLIGRVVSVRDRLLGETRGPIAVISHKKFLSALIWVLLAGEPKISSKRMTRYHGFDHGMSIKNGAMIPTRWAAGQVWIGPTCVAHLTPSR